METKLYGFFIFLEGNESKSYFAEHQKISSTMSLHYISPDN